MYSQNTGLTEARSFIEFASLFSLDVLGVGPLDPAVGWLSPFEVGERSAGRKTGDRGNALDGMTKATSPPLGTLEPEFATKGRGRRDAVPAVAFGGFRLEADGTLVRDGTIVHLPPKELAALSLLVAHAGQIVTPLQLRQTLWGDVHVTADSVPRCLSSLRARLEPEVCIQTVYKRGYRFSAEIRHHATAFSNALPRLAILPFVAGYTVPEYLGAAIAEETAT